MEDSVDQKETQEIFNRRNFILRNSLREGEEFFPVVKSIEQIMSSDRINPLMLEGEIIDRGLDNFIREVMRRKVPRRKSCMLFLDIKPDTSYFSSRTGLFAYPKEIAYRGSLTVNGEKVTLEDYHNIHFTPGGRCGFDPSKITESLTNLIQGFIELIDTVNQGKFDASPIFVGTTNINMALILQRLGFVIIDECRNSDGGINRNLQSFTVVGSLEDIRARVEEFKKTGVVQKLEQRSQKLQAKPKPVPSMA